MHLCHLHFNLNCGISAKLSSSCLAQNDAIVSMLGETAM